MPGNRFQSLCPARLTGAGWVCLIGSLLCATIARGDDFATTEGPTEAAAGVLVMRNGTVMSGLITQEEEFYTVQGKYGNVQVPLNLVKLRSSTLQSAYAKLHELTVAHCSANSHLSLARWCVTNNLSDEAMVELNDALELEPDRDDAKRMLESLKHPERNQPRPAARPPVAENDRGAKPRRPDQAAGWQNAMPSPADDASTLGDLSRPLALHYVRRIQPLLVKSCATTGCHARDSDHGFELFRVVPGKSGTRHASEQNLSAVLDLIDLDHPASSRLLTVTRHKHGRNGKPVFSGSKGEEQYAELEQWIQGLAAEDRRRRQQETGGPAKKSGVRQASASDAEATRPDERDPFSGKPGGPVSLLRGDRRERTMDDSRQADPFDPAVFNRQSSSRNSRK